MAFNSVADISRAFDAGRVWSNRWYKTAVSANSQNIWVDESFQGGHPAYQARIGSALSFTPQINNTNQSLYIPPAPGFSKHLIFMTYWNSNSGGPDNVILFDLLGFYSQIDGDNPADQVFDNTLTLPRYASAQETAAAVLSSLVDGTYTLADLVRLITAATCGVDKGTLINPQLTNLAGTKVRITGTMAGGKRYAATYDASEP